MSTRDETNALIRHVSWMKALQRIEGLQKVCDGILSYPKDCRRDLAEQALALIAQLRRARSHGLDLPYPDLARLERLCADADSRILKPLIETGAKYRATQRAKARKGAAARWSTNEAKAEVDSIIEDLQSAQYEDWTHAERWNEFLGLLDVALLDPQENVDHADGRKTFVTYTSGGRLTFGAFRNLFRAKTRGA